MGGNALKNVKTNRINKDEYIILKNDIIRLLSINDIVVDTIMESPNKESYGDLDLLYLSSTKYDIRQQIIKIFSPNEIVVNGDVISFDYNNFQIDLIKCISLEQMACSKFYFSYGDLGCIIGRLCSNHGLKFGQYGLFLIIYENTIYPESNSWEIISKNIFLTSDVKTICYFLDFDYDRYLLGFNSVENVFDWIMKSKYFSPSIFITLNREHIRRIDERPMYSAFIDYIQIDKSNIVKTAIKCKDMVLHNEAIIFFNKTDELNNIKTKLEYNKKIREKFSGKYLVEKKICGKKVGEFLEKIKVFITNKYSVDFDEWIYHTDQNVINSQIDEILDDINK